MTEDEVLMKVKELHSRMFAYALGRLRNRQDAEDVLLEAQLAIWKARKQCDGLETFDSWAFIILRNKMIDHFRQDPMDREFFVDETILETIGDSSPDPEQRLLQPDRLRLVHEAISSLKDDEAEIVLLRLADFSNKQIADQLKKPEGTVRSTYSRVIQKIRKFIEDREGPNSYAGK